MCDFYQTKSGIDSGIGAPFHFQLYPAIAFSALLSVETHSLFSTLMKVLESKKTPFLQSMPYNTQLFS